jgi:hypothetical protein
MTHVNASVKIHPLANTHTTITPILVNVTADLMIAMLVNTLIQRAVAVSAQSTRPATTINTSMVQRASVNAVMSRNVEMDSIMTMTHVNASVEIHQLANTHTSTIHTLASAFVSLTIVPLTNTSTIRLVVAAATIILPVPATNTSTIHHVNASAVT